MSLVLRTLKRGRACTLAAIGSEDQCLLWDFLDDLRRDLSAEFARMLALLEHTAEHGPPRNEQKCRFIREYQLFEFKGHGGCRVMAFWDENRLIVCTHGFMKKSRKTPRRELERAAEARARYFSCKQLNQLVWEEENKP